MKDDIDMYAYVKNNPVNGVDPSGLEKILIILALDHNDVAPVFWKDWLTTNWKDSYIASQYNSVAQWYTKKGQKFDIRIVTDFSQFDNAINEKQRKEIILIAHWNQNSIGLSENQSVITTPGANYFNTINQQSLSLDDQTKEQREKLSKTELYLLSCSTGDNTDGASPIAQSIETHYNFKATHAPSTTIYVGGAMYDEKTSWSPNLNNLFNMTTSRQKGQLNTFTSN